ncbi:hydroxysqualene dehydroxylase HpnE [Actinomycetospora endophytica]|uniref:Hydroxysqualene dehydroxylase HpnE n=1 Tax=Actinomycetospora endophytica TaxID=2291215 RepID=A0ABS8P9W9_9PSEU|nr:hydroxysqualene dehydroxylase HpnE [Actinomycetospora endophytica]MCD2194315.1 hydroxysqualene dehydroxylase HpnE [Actinomycetospora endophytica]
MRIAVLGGGLAGVSAALRCADDGHEVTLLERRARLGGLAGSFRRGDAHVDTGQHVFLRCCHAYRGLLARLDVTGSTTLQERLDVTVLRPGAPPARLRRDRVPAPLHLARALLRYDPVPWRERLALPRAAAALRRLDPADPAVDAQSFGEWLRRHGQGPAATRALWDLIGTPTLNARADDASLALAATVFRIGLLGEPDAADIGWSAVPLGELHDTAARRALDDAGVRVRLAARVRDVARDLAPDDGGWRVAVAGRDGAQDVLAVDAVISALPPEEAAALLPDPVGAQVGAAAEALGASPIVDVHLVLDRPVLDVPFAAGLDTEMQWVFDRSAAHGALPDGAQYLVVSLSAADEYVGLGAAALVEHFRTELARLLPRAAAARLLDGFVTREPRATFRPAPGSGARRPAGRTALPALALAGAWTDTGWPATMEGAVRSGQTAAAVVTRGHHDRLPGHDDRARVAA